MRSIPESVSSSPSRRIATVWLRRMGVVLIVLVVLAVVGMGYRLAKAYATFHTVAFAVHKTRVNIIDPNGMTVGEPFAFGLKPAWWYGQWLIVPMTTPARKTILLRVLLEQKLFSTQITRIELACVQHDPEANDEAKAYGIERTPVGIEVKNIPPKVFLGDRPVDVKRWFPGSFRL